MSGTKEMLIWQEESGLYLVAHPKLDLISQGTTEQEALSSFLEVVAVLALHIADDDGRVQFKVAPPEVAAEWAAKATAFASTETK